MNFVCKSGFIELKKKLPLKGLYFCHNDALSYCCWVFVERVGAGCSPKFCSMPGQFRRFHASVFSRLCDVNDKLNCKKIIVQ